MEYIITILLMYSAPGAVPAPQLAKAIMVYSTKYKVDPVLVTKIIIVESKGKADAKNRFSNDHGLMQINAKTAASFGIDAKCLYNWRCNLQYGVKMLAKLKRPCHYNVGPSGPARHGFGMCLKYESKLASIK